MLLSRFTPRVATSYKTAGEEVDIPYGHPLANGTPNGIQAGPFRTRHEPDPNLDRRPVSYSNRADFKAHGPRERLDHARIFTAT
jgi:hypothetical protein